MPVTKSRQGLKAHTMFPHDASQHGDTTAEPRVLEVSIGIIGNVARRGRLMLRRVRRCVERRERFPGAGRKGAAYGGKRQFQTPALIGDGMSLRKMHGDTLPQRSDCTKQNAANEAGWPSRAFTRLAGLRSLRRLRGGPLVAATRRDPAAPSCAQGPCCSPCMPYRPATP